MDQRLAEGRDYWDRHARVDPMWAVLSDPAKKGRKWKLQEFMRNGEREIALVFHKLAQLQCVPGTGTALDFGCGVGRLTQALARRFDRVIGVDISASMIALARQINQYTTIADYFCNPRPDLRDVPLDACDFIYSNIVLQHVPSDLSVEYLREFFRILKPNGVLVFQLPSHQESQADPTIRAMADDAYRAGLRLSSPIPESVEVSAPVLAAVQIVNLSERVWRQRDFGSIRVGNHWFDATGQLMLVQDDGRAVLPQVVGAGEGCDVALQMTAPASPGKFVCEIDVAHEGITWFRDKGSETLRFMISVESQNGSLAATSVETIDERPIPEYRADDLDDAAVGEPASAKESQPFPMYGVPQSDVLEIIRTHEAQVVHIEPGFRAGPEWVDYRYYVRARARVR